MRWAPLAAASTPPSKRFSSSAVILYGGTQGGAQLEEVWVLEVLPGAARSVWIRPALGGVAPPGRSSHSACLVRNGRKHHSSVLMFGGTGLDDHGSTLALSDVAILELYAISAVDDSDGAIFRATTLAEVKEGTEEVTFKRREISEPLGRPLALRWTHRASAPAGAEVRWPKARQAHAACTAFDDGVVVYGGTHGFELLADLWVCRLSEGGASVEWESPVCSGSPPPESAGHSLSAVGVRCVLAGGSILDTAFVLGDWGGRCSSSAGSTR